MSPIVRDLGRKLDEDVADTINRAMRLVSDGLPGIAGADAMSQVATLGAASALGCAAGTFLAVHRLRGGHDATPEELVDALLSILRPIAVRSMAKGMEARP